jgi:CubicO group peptidase (beta-lactamase class C family)
MLLVGGEVGGRQLLSKASVAAMTRDHLTAEQRLDGAAILQGGRGWGYGMAVATDPTPEGVPAGAYGWNGGLGTSWVADPASGVSVIVLTQTLFESPAAPNVHGDVWRAVFGGQVRR